MKYTIVGDPHTKSNNLDLSKDLLKMVEKRKKPVIWLGDIFDTKEIIRGKPLNLWLSYFRKSKLQHFVIVGNHDLFNLQTTEHSLECFKEFGNVTIIDDLTQIDENTYGIPYIHDQTKLKEVLKKIPKGSNLIAHLELKDFDFGNGHICDKGLTFKDFKKFDKVITGHFHKFQQKENVTYLGTPFSHSFGEANQPKYLATLGEDLELHEITKFPRHIIIKFDLDQELDLSGLNDRDYFRFDLKGSTHQLAAIQDQILDLKEKYPKLKVREIDTDTYQEYNELDEDLNCEKQFQVWATEVANYDEYTIDLALEYLK